MEELNPEKYNRFFKLIKEAKKAKYSNEIQLLNDQHKSENNHSSILFYTTFKCASVYVTDILIKLTKNVGMTPIDLNGYAWETGELKEKLQVQTAFDPKIFKTGGYFYGSFREFDEWQIPNLERFRIILMLRDPRDILTSLYFSHAYSHAIPLLNQEEMLELRKRALRMSIDEYVIESIPKYLKIYRQYCQKLLSKPNVLFVTYEKMVMDFDTWLDTVIEFLLLKVSQQLVSQIKEEADFSVKDENIYAHKRQVIPGEHRRKLKSETIEILNSNFAEILDVLGYSKL